MLTSFSEVGFESRKKEAAFVTKNRQLRAAADSEGTGIGGCRSAFSRLTRVEFTLLILAYTYLGRSYLEGP